MIRWLAILLLLPTSLCGQTGNASSPDFRKRAEADARKQLAEAIRTENWALVKETAEQLDQLRRIDKAQEKPEPTTGFQKLQKAGFSLSRSPDEEKKGARFGVTHNFRDDSSGVFDADFYLKWAAPTWHDESFRFWNTLAISAQGKLSGSKNTSDAWRFRLEERFWTYNREETASRVFDGIVATLSLKDESDRDFKMNRLSAELWLTPNARRLWIGQYSGADTDWLQIRWRPYIGVDAGDTITRSSDEDESTSRLWLLARGRVDLRLNALRRALGFSEVVAYVDDKFVHLTDGDSGHNYLNTGIDFEFSDNVGFTLQYTLGADSPKFTAEELFKGGFTVKF